MQKINERIKMLREQHAFSQEQMAEKMNISTNSYGKLERGETKISIDKLETIAQIFDLDIVELMNTGERNISYQFNNNSAFYAVNVHGKEVRDFLVENEKLQLVISHKEEIIRHKDETIAQQKNEIALLKQILALSKEK
ncbi:hypothetical protein A4G19_02945 [Pasteurellaceae bacterium Macca]|nr:hypothetical protein [Pasteurellaceae bacterium Macca]